MYSPASYAILDDFLKALKNYTQEQALPQPTLLGSKPFLNLSSRDKDGCIKKLIKDGFIEQTTFTEVGGLILPAYFITFEGLMLLEEDGYVGRLQMQKAIFAHQDKLAVLVANLTRWIAVGTALAAVVALLAFAVPFFHTSYDAQAAQYHLPSAVVSDSAQKTKPQIPPQSK
jgi:hypothetical protein